MTTARTLFLFGLLALVVASSAMTAGCGGAGDRRPNILLITLDTTRADHLGVYGYERNTSPNIDAFAAESVVYTDALSTASWTLPAHASLFTGKFTWSHGARYDPEGPLRLLDAIDGRPSWETYRARGLSRDESTLAGTLSDAGYRTGAIVGGPWLKKVFGLDAGFEDYDDREISTLAGRVADNLTDSALAWLDGQEDDPFFLFLNYFDAHAPYNPPLPFLERILPGAGDEIFDQPSSVEENVALYDAEILFMDHHVGRLFQGLKDRGLYDDTWIIVTADHGQLLGEHGEFGHGKYLYQEEIHVPLIVRHAGAATPPGRVEDRIQLTDIYPWICERLGLETPAMQGNAPPAIEHPILAETYPLPAHSSGGAWRAIFDGDYKFIWSSLEQHQLFNLRKDPGEMHNLFSPDSKQAHTLFTTMRDYLAELPLPGEAGDVEEIDPETREALESLGYIN